jgi:hypothetical protein
MNVTTADLTQSPVPSRGNSWRDSVLGAVLTIAAGVLLIGYVWWSRDQRSLVPLLASIAGPVACSIGIAKLVHPRRVTLGSMNPLLRGYAIAGTLLGLVQLYLLGAFVHPDPFTLFPVWLIMGVVWFGKPRRRVAAEEGAPGEAK